MFKCSLRQKANPPITLWQINAYIKAAAGKTGGFSHTSVPVSIKMWTEEEKVDKRVDSGYKILK